MTEVSTTQMTTFVCPYCERDVIMHTKNIMAHILNGCSMDRAEAAKIVMESVHGTLYYCKIHMDYTPELHLICDKCPDDGYGKCYPVSQSQQLDKHIFEDHTSEWFLEKFCKNGADCSGNDGTCGYNHIPDMPNSVLASELLTLSQNYCQRDKPFDGVRCDLVKCNFVHFAGRAKFVAKNSQLNYAKALTSQSQSNGTKASVPIQLRTDNKTNQRKPATWMLEKNCKFGFDCRGRNSGVCPHNHYDLGEFITDDDDIPDDICPEDMPWERKSCTKKTCDYDHFRGRVKFCLSAK